MGIFSRSRKTDQRAPQPIAVQGTSLFPGGGQWGAIDLPNASQTVVLGLPAASRAVNLISNAVAQMAPLDCWGDDGFILADTPPILTRPNVGYGAFEFWQQAVATAIMTGNFLGLLTDYQDGYPQQIVPVPAGFWTVYFDGAGYQVYAIGGEIYSREQVFHVRTGATANQPMGIGVVSQFRRAIGQALDQQNFTADVYRSGSVPAGVIKLDRPEIDQAQAEAIVSAWISNHAGGRAPAVLPNTMTFEPLQWSPEDMQFLDARGFTVAEIAFMFGLDPTDLSASIGTSSTLTYANLEQRTQARITDTYAPWMRRFEEELSDLIPEGTARFDADKLLRTDSKTRAEVHAINLTAGIESVDEARRHEGRRPLPKPEPAPEPAPAPTLEIAPAEEDAA